MGNQNIYSKPVTLRNILKFAVPTIAMSVFMSFYTMVDGLFVSNLIGTDALSAINLTAPVIQLVTAISTMLATGGSAVIMKKMGEHRNEEAKEDFTFLILVNVAAGLVMCGAGYLVMERIFAGMDLSAAVAGYCTEYLSRYLLFTVPILLMNNFTLYMIASEKAALSLLCSVAGGVLNMVLDYVLIEMLSMGIGGAAVATGLGYSVTAVTGLFVFSRKKSLLHFKRPVLRLRVLAAAASNGCSEMATALVTGIVTMMFNWTMLRYVGEDGVAAVTIIMYVLMFASSLYTGYSYGVAPMISYYFGEQRLEEQKGTAGFSEPRSGRITGLRGEEPDCAALSFAEPHGGRITGLRGKEPDCAARSFAEPRSGKITELRSEELDHTFSLPVKPYDGQEGETGSSAGKLKKLISISLRVIAFISVLTVVASLLLTKPLVSVFARPDNPVFALAVTGNRICTASLLFIGFNIFASGMFTALSNGVISAVLAFSRSFVFMLITMLVLPALLGVNGIWLATPAAELMALALSAAMFRRYRKKYGY